MRHALFSDQQAARTGGLLRLRQPSRGEQDFLAGAPQKDNSCTCMFLVIRRKGEQAFKP
jgi:hypothetical protein